MFSDLESFLLKDKPAGRLPVKTRPVPPDKRKDMLGRLKKEALGGNQVFWVVPQVGGREEEAAERVPGAAGPHAIRNGSSGGW